jgi:Glycosyl hydrolases family 16
MDTSPYAGLPEPDRSHASAPTQQFNMGATPIGIASAAVPQSREATPTEVTSAAGRRRKRRDLFITVLGGVLLVSALVYVQWPKGSDPSAKPADSNVAQESNGTTSASAAANPNGAASSTASPSHQPGSVAASSGVPMPVGNIPGWRQTFADDFTSADLGSTWHVYDGQPGGDPLGWFMSSHVHSGDGMLTINASKENTANGLVYATGGVNNSKVFSQTYGRYEIRFRMDKAYGIAYALLLWPSDNTWPPEIDIAEDNAKNRNMTSATVHYGANNSMIHRETSGDFTQWHTARVDWSPGKVVYRLDDKIWTTISSVNVPKTPMSIAIQAQAWPCGTWEGCPNSSTPPSADLQIDWVVAYAATG